MFSYLTKKSFPIIVLLSTYMCVMYVAEGLFAALLFDIAREFKMGIGTIGQLSTLLGGIWGLTAPLIGPLSDKLGRRWMLVSGHIVAGIALIGYAVSSNLSSLAGFSILLGIGGAIGGPATLAAVGDFFSAHIRGRIMSVVNTGPAVSALVGVPMLTVIAGYLGWRWGFLLLGFVVIGVAVSGLIILPKQVSEAPKERIHFAASISGLFREKWLAPLLVAVAMLNGANYVITVYFVAFLMQTYSLTAAQVGPFLSVMAVGQLLGILAGGPLADKFSKIRVSAVMHGLTGLSAVALMSFHNYFWLSTCLGGLFLAFGNTARASYLSLFTFVSPESRSTVMGIQSAANRLGRAAGAAGGGLVVMALGYTHLGLLCLLFNLVAVGCFLYTFSVLNKGSVDRKHGLG